MTSERVLTLRAESKAYYRAFELTGDETLKMISESLDRQAVELEIRI